ncbi:MAG: hypothetical protein PHO32_00495 [Candidatus Cloacimonetes bacterium]|nr:hypothetical protein [Candidatus Cloacimonadota bacterium]
MIGVGNAELIVLIIIAIIILGPKDTMAYVKKIKKFIFKIKEYKNEIETDLNNQIHEEQNLEEKSDSER